MATKVQAVGVGRKDVAVERQWALDLGVSSILTKKRYQRAVLGELRPISLRTDGQPCPEGHLEADDAG